MLNTDHLTGCYRMWYSLSKDHQGVGWIVKEEQIKRFDRASKMFENKEPEVLDIGCGLGHYYFYLLKNGYKAKYSGIDLVPEFVTVCRGQLMNAHKKDINQIDRDYDYAVAIGTFHYMTFDCEDVKTVIKRYVKKIMKHTKKKFFFTLLKKAMDPYHTFTKKDIKEITKGFTGVKVQENEREYFVTVSSG